MEFTAQFILGSWEVVSLLNSHGSLLPQIQAALIPGPALEGGEAGVSSRRVLRSDNLASSLATGPCLPL